MASIMPDRQREELEKAAAAALKAAQQPAAEFRDLNDDQVRFIGSYWSQRPRESNDDTLKRIKR